VNTGTCDRLRRQPTRKSIPRALETSWRYDYEVIEVTRTGDPQLSHVEELWRERPDGKTEFVARCWYLPKI